MFLYMRGNKRTFPIFDKIELDIDSSINNSGKWNGEVNFWLNSLIPHRKLRFSEQNVLFPFLIKKLFFLWSCNIKYKFISLIIIFFFQNEFIFYCHNLINKKENYYIFNNLNIKLYSKSSKKLNYIYFIFKIIFTYRA